MCSSLFLSAKILIHSNVSFCFVFLSLQVIGSDHDYHFVHHALPHARTKRSVLHTRQLKADPLVSSMRHAIFTRLYSFIQFCLVAAYIYVYIDMDHHSLFFLLTLFLCRRILMCFYPSIPQICRHFFWYFFRPVPFTLLFCSFVAIPLTHKKKTFKSFLSIQQVAVSLVILDEKRLRLFACR